MAANQAVFDARVQIADHLQADPLEIIFTSSCTDALNLLIHGLPRGSRICTTSVEHNSVLRPLREREARGDISLSTVSVDAAGRVDLSQPRPDCDAMLLAAASNVLAGRNDLAALRQWLGADIRLLLDGAQLVGELASEQYMPYADAVAAPGHKALGAPPGTGFVYLHPRLDLRPWRQGGTGSRSESARQPDDRPDGFEAGSQNLWGIIGLGVAAQICEPDRWRVAEQLAQDLRDALSTSGQFRVLGAHNGACAPLVSFVPVRPTDINEMGAVLWQRHAIAVRTGLHCAPGAHAHAGTLGRGALRASFGPEHTQADLEALLRALYTEVG